MRTLFILLGALFLMSSLWLTQYVRRRGLLSKRKTIFINIIVLIMCVCFSLLPWENILLNFDTPEDAFLYAKQGEILMQAEGEQTVAMLYEEDKGPSGILFLEKTEGEYKICSEYAPRRFLSLQSNSVSIYFYYIRETSDYYVHIIGATEDDLVVTDSTGSSFEVPCGDFQGHPFVNYSSSVDYTEGYALYINGVKVN